MSVAQGLFTFAAVNAVDLQGYATAHTAQLNVFSSYIDTKFNETAEGLAELNTKTEAIAAARRRSALMQGADLTELRDGFIRMDQVQENIKQAGTKVVAELAEMMQGFRLELIATKRKTCSSTS